MKALIVKGDFEMCFHSTKEVSKESGNKAATSPDGGFHSTKEVSKAWPTWPRVIWGGTSFHSTKEVSKGRCEKRNTEAHGVFPFH